jgi:hypothetical protein
MRKNNVWIQLLSMSVIVSLLSFNFAPIARSQSTRQQKTKAATQSSTHRDEPKGAEPASKESELFVDKDNDKAQPIDVDQDRAQQGQENEDADLPAFMHGKINETEYLLKRQEAEKLRLGFGPDEIPDAAIRTRSIQQMERQEANLQAAARRMALNPKGGNPYTPKIASGVWTEIGPKPIPNGQTSTVVQPVSGRTPAIAVDPTNPNIVYAGAAQGGVYRSLNGGMTWVQLFNTAQSLAIGAITVAPSNPNIVYVGTGEAGRNADGFAGVGVYRIDNATTTADLTGPIDPQVSLNLTGIGVTSLPSVSGRGISELLVNPTDPSIIFVSTGSGAIGNPNATPFNGAIPPRALQGIYRITNANGPAAGAVAQKLVTPLTDASGCLDTPCTGNAGVFDMVFDPSDPNILVEWELGAAAADGGIFRSTNALAATPTFTQVLGQTSAAARGELTASRPVGATFTTMYLASGESTNGRVRKSVDGGATWSAALAGGSGFCGGQCFYDIAIAADPTDANYVHLGGQSSAGVIKQTSTDGGATFVNNSVGLHADNHALTIAPSSVNVVYDGTDGGIWRSNDRGVSWFSLSNSGYSATQFQSLGIHATDRYLTIGGTQDNGTEMQKANNEPNKPEVTWTRADFGDGGYARIDQTSTDPVNVTMYHTYFNQTNNLIGFSRVSSTACAYEGNWALKGFGATAGAPNACGDVAGPNGITGTDAVNFYAPLELGPPAVAGQPNSVYFGTDRLYKSVDRGDTMTVVSQGPFVAGVPVSTIAIAPTNDAFRLVGLNNGQVFATNAGLPVGPTTMTDVTPVAVASRRVVGKVVFAPSDPNIAFIGYGGQSSPAGAVTHLFKATTFGTGTPTFTAVGTGLPDQPVDSIAVDPVSASIVYVGTDIGVYVSTDGGANFAPYGTGLPRVAVFDMAIQNAGRFLRIATHGRGMWEISLLPAASLTISGTVTVTGAADNSGVVIKVNNVPQVTTGASGAYTITGISPGDTYTVTASKAGYDFTPPFYVFTDITNNVVANFTATLGAAGAAPTPGSVIISEFRTRGAGGAADDFIELYNTTTSPITVDATDSSDGWGLVYLNAAGTSIGFYTVIPNGTVIPARGHLLLSGSTYSLKPYAAGDFNTFVDLPDGTAFGLFSSSVTSINVLLSTRLDGVAFTSAGGNGSLFGEGTAIPNIGTTNAESSFVRKGALGVNGLPTEFPQDTNDNNADFVLVSTDAGTFNTTVAVLGAPGPENLQSPISRDTTQITRSLVEPTASISATPNQDRNFTAVSTLAPTGTLTLRRRFTNNTGATITRLRFKIVDITTLNSPVTNPPQAILRALDSGSSAVISLSNPSPGACVQGTLVEQLPVQPLGGGVNSTYVVDLSGDATTLCNDDGVPGLSNGEGINVQWVLGVQQGGRFRFFVSVDALP